RFSPGRLSSCGVRGLTTRPSKGLETVADCSANGQRIVLDLSPARTTNRAWAILDKHTALALQAEWRHEARLSSKAKLERQKLAQYASSWMSIKLPNLKTSTAKGYALVLDGHIIPRFGEYYLDAIEPIDVKTWIAQGSRASTRAIRCAISSPCCAKS